MTVSHPAAERIRTLRVMALALSAFIFNTTEFIPIALLSDIGESFAMPAHEVGVMMTVYAWIVACLSLPAMLATASIERKKLLLGLFVLFVASHVLTVFAPNFTVLLIARAGVALSHAVFWSITASLVVRVAPKGKQTKALGMLATGSALATVLGLPLGRILGQYLGWRTTFGAIGVAALLCMLVLWWILPRLPSRNVGNLSSLPHIIKNKPLLIVYALIALIVTAHFTAYSYVEPFVLTINGFSANYATAVLLVFGAAGIVASWLFGRYYERFADGFVWAALVGVGLGLGLMLTLAQSWAIWTMLAVVWGVSMTAISLALQLRTLKLAPNATDVAMSLFSGIYNVGIGGGALVGGLVIANIGLPFVGYVGAVIVIIALLIFAYGQRLANRTT
ncbi:sugar transporter [Moraxella caviae]|uniref:Sugar efflux transporter B n=1 Tax=Moraxella caviae TaxID=34060 RepID=A0A1T0ACU2_9GAMM|nr:sugar transporter [Moraxella caviae]OOR93512.1 sugar transporter [Moraxella caviae]STZ10344.1 Sugar efflux transporter B [Moraxella caviae]VEW14196.1 Sugar efflux transporter B [Moraxella caviae]